MRAQNHVHFSNLAIALLKLGVPEHAITAATRCTELAPDFAKGHYRLGQAYRARQDPAAAAEAFAVGLPHAQGRELAEMARELKACQTEAAAKARAEASGAATGGTATAGATVVGGGTAAAASTAAAPAGATSEKVKGKVDRGKAVETAKRVAEMTKPMLPAPTTFSGFERGLRTLWAGRQGRGGGGGRLPRQSADGADGAGQVRWREPLGRLP